MYQISLKSVKLFVDGRTDWRTDIPPQMLLGRLGGVHLIINNNNLNRNAEAKLFQLETNEVKLQ